LKAVAAAGYRQVELSPLTTTSAKDLKKMLDDACLKTLQGTTMVVTVPWVADPSRFKPDPQLGQIGVFIAIINGLTLDDWKRNAEQFNKVGEQIKKAGLR